MEGRLRDSTGMQGIFSSEPSFVELEVAEYLQEQGEYLSPQTSRSSPRIEEENLIGHQTPHTPCIEEEEEDALVKKKQLSGNIPISSRKTGSDFRPSDDFNSPEDIKNQINKDNDDIYYAV